MVFERYVPQHRLMYVFLYQSEKIMAQKCHYKNMLRALYLRFILTSTVSDDCYVFFGTFIRHFNVLMLIEVFTVTDLPGHAFCNSMFMFAKIYKINNKIIYCGTYIVVQRNLRSAD